MKNQNFISKNSEQIRLLAEEIYTLEKGITKTLLEKYKPRNISNLQSLSDREVEKKVS